MAAQLEPKPVEFVVLGARGQLAREFLRVLGDRALGLDRAQCDFASPGAPARVLAPLHPRVVFNCAAYNHVDRAETERDAALAANARAPATLAQLAVAQGFRLVHFSTDYVFGADRLARPRTESDPPAPINFYGYSKLLGEEAVLRHAPDASGILVLRVAHLYGGHSLSPGRLTLAERFLDLARSGQPIRITRGQWLNPTPVASIVAATLDLVARGARGLRHVVGDPCPAEEFARRVLAGAGLDGRIELVAGDPRPAPRALNTTLARSPGLLWP